MMSHSWRSKGQHFDQKGIPFRLLVLFIKLIIQLQQRALFLYFCIHLPLNLEKLAIISVN